MISIRVRTIRFMRLCDYEAVHLVTAATEHPSTLETLRFLSREHKFQLTILPVDQRGLVSPEVLRQAVTAETALVSITHAGQQ